MVIEPTLISHRPAQLPAVITSQSTCWNSASTPRPSAIFLADVDVEADERAVRLEK